MPQARKFGITLLLALFSAISAHPQSAKAISNLQDSQLTGIWYQIARYPNKREKKCLSNVYQLIARGEKPHQLQLVTSCKTKASYADVRNYSAHQNKKIQDGRLKITTIWPFTRNYWILATDPQFDWFLAATPDHKNLWIYAKTSTIPQNILQQIETIATTNGFTTPRIKMTPQTGNNAPTKQMIAQ